MKKELLALFALWNTVTQGVQATDTSRDLRSKKHTPVPTSYPTADDNLQPGYKIDMTITASIESESQFRNTGHPDYKVSFEISKNRKITITEEGVLVENMHGVITPSKYGLPVRPGKYSVNAEALEQVQDLLGQGVRVRLEIVNNDAAGQMDINFIPQRTKKQGKKAELVDDQANSQNLLRLSKRRISGDRAGISQSPRIEAEIGSLTLGKMRSITEAPSEAPTQQETEKHNKNKGSGKNG